MEDKDYIKDLFNEKLNGFEANVRPELWANISSQLGTTTASTVGSGMSLLAKSIIGISIAAAIGGLTFLLLKEKASDNKNASNNTVPTQVNTPSNQSAEINSELEKIDDSIQENKKIEQKNSPAEISQDWNTDITWISPIAPIEKEVEHKNVSPLNERSNDAVGVTGQGEKNNTTTGVNKDTEANKSNMTIPAEDPIETPAEEESIGKLTNIFTPNGDRINDYLSVESKGLTDFSIVVLDKNSKIVYQSNEPNFMWDGVGMNGEMVPSGNYVYYITARDAKGNLISKHSILRIER